MQGLPFWVIINLDGACEWVWEGVALTFWGCGVLQAWVWTRGHDDWVGVAVAVGVAAAVVTVARAWMDLSCERK